MKEINKKQGESSYFRILKVRDMGKIKFADTIHSGHKIQLVIASESCSNFHEADKLSIGDLISISGEKGNTKTGEPSIFVSHILGIKKNVSGLGHQNVCSQHQRFHNRHIDLALHPEQFNLWKGYSAILRSIRLTLDNYGFMEFPTGVLQEKRDAGLANAFTTQRKNKKEYYLSLTSELKLKKLLAGGFTRVYEIAPSFRNEGVNKEHLPEFSLLEAYAVDWSLDQIMVFIEALIRSAVKESGVEQIKMSSDSPFEKINFYDLWYSITQNKEVSLSVLVEKFPKLFTPKMPEFTWIYKFICKCIVPYYIAPVFIVGIPMGFSPFAKAYPEDPRFMKGGIVVTEGLHLATFSEDNNNYDEVKVMLERQSLLTGIPINHEFLDVLRFGIPLSGGVGIGINRLIMALFSCTNGDARETCLYPVY